MNVQKPNPSPATGETRLLIQALAGDIHAVDKLLQYLGSSNPNIRKIMLDSILSFNQPDLYHHLLVCLAQGEWEIQTASGLVLRCSRRSEPLHADRIEDSIIELFSQTHLPEQVTIIEDILSQALHAHTARLRHAAAYLFACRGNSRVLPQLEEVIEHAGLIWKIRTVRILVDLDDPRCGLLLVKALSMQPQALHEEARRALCELGARADAAWISALNHPDSHIRWHAARGLGEIGDERAIEILAAGLMDENHAVRWATARVLARLDAAAVPAILDLISCNPLTEPLRQAAYHALHAMNSQQTQDRLEPLLIALHSQSANIGAPGIARRLLSAWQHSAAKKSQRVSA
jgi:HEAT repeat protein